MTEEINEYFLSVEKENENEYESINNDYEILKSIYPDDIKEIKNNSNELHFLLKLKHEIEIQNSTIDLLHSMKLDDLLNCSNDNCMYLPYWINIYYSTQNKKIKIRCYIFWFKYEENLKSEIEKALSGNFDEPILYNIIEEYKNIVNNTLRDKTILLNLLTEIRELIVMELHTTTDNFLLNETGANDDINEDFKYEELKLRHPSNNITNNKEKIQKNKKKEKSKNETKKEEEDKECNYEKFLKEGGYVGDTITDRASTFQAHAIKIQNKKEVDFYRKCLLSQKKIKKATHNIIIYRYIDKDTKQVVEDYDDDGEDGAGFRVLGVVQKMKLVNLFVMVTRWFGGTLLHQDRFKRINDAAQMLLNQHLDVFESKNE